ncbi:MAG: hypothetical protein Q9170_006644 [Blastenia crenularia]
MIRAAILFFASLWYIAGTVNGQQSWSGWSSIEKVFVFGASYVTNGFDVEGSQPDAAAGNPFGNPPGFGKTSTDGPNMIEYLTTKYNESLISTYDFAVSGAVVDGSIYNQPNVDFVAQVYDRFLPHYSYQETAGALFAIFFAVNDVYKSYSRTNNPIDAIFATFTRLLEQLYTTGARNFLLLNSIPVDRTPKILVQGPNTIAAVSKYNTAFNTRLAAMANALNSTHPDANVFLFDIHALFEEVLDDPSAFPQTESIRNIDGFCPAYHASSKVDDYDPRCGLAVNEYFWLDALHPTAAVHEAAPASALENRGPDVYSRKPLNAAYSLKLSQLVA